MKITKDEARLLSEALHESKYDLVSTLYKKEDKIEAITAIEFLEKKLKHFGQDNRRTGRTSLNDYTDLLKRIINKHKQ